jgi:16S rRNA (guanine527-N7)-methyltransferase
LATCSPGRTLDLDVDAIRPAPWQSGIVSGEGLSPKRIELSRARVDPALGAIYQRSFELGFLGSMPIADQIEHALGFVAILEESGSHPSSVIDIGTGGGIPGLVLASCWPETRVVLMDANERRTAFLQEVVDGWAGGGHCQVVRGRAEELGREEDLRELFDAVTSRSFGPPAATAECGSPFLAVGGSMVVSEPPDTDLRERWPTPDLAQLGLAPVATLRPVERFGYQVLTKVEALDSRYPRRVGVPVKRPLF